MFDRASMKLGLDKAVLQSMRVQDGNVVSSVTTADAGAGSTDYRKYWAWLEIFLNYCNLSIVLPKHSSIYYIYYIIYKSGVKIG